MQDAPSGNPSWLATPAAAAAVTQPPPGLDPFRAHAEWFAWARRTTADPALAHAAARSAVDTLRSGAGSDAAATAASGVLAAPAPGPIDVDVATRVYSNWYAWAANQLRLDTARAHAAAAAGYQAQSAGQPVDQAQAAAMRAAGLTAPPPGFRAGGVAWYNDSAIRAIIFGVVCLVAPFVFGFYFYVLPVLGLVYSVRALGGSRRTLGIVGVVLNGLATLLSAALFFRLL
jgi:hypothetical protein